MKFTPFLRADTKYRYSKSLVLYKEEVFGTDLRVRLKIGYETDLLLLQRIEQIDVHLLRGPAPKKPPMISGSKIERADFYFPCRGYRMLFKNEFLLFQFRFKPNISSR